MSVNGALACLVGVVLSIVAVVVVSPYTLIVLAPLSVLYWRVQWLYITTSRELKRLDALVRGANTHTHTHTLTHKRKRKRLQITSAPCVYRYSPVRHLLASPPRRLAARATAPDAAVLWGRYLSRARRPASRTLTSVPQK
jgi:hypothetical protein